MSVISRDKVLDKVRKLIALSGSSNVHEAEVAASAAQRLMLEHKIEMSEITTETTEEDVVMEAEIYRDLGMSAPPRWHGVLLSGIARANFCMVIVERERVRESYYSVSYRKTYRIVGTVADRAAVRYLYEMLRAEIERLCTSHGRLFGYDRAEKASFKLGAASSISDKIVHAAHDFEVQTHQGNNANAIAVIDKTRGALDRFVKATYPSLRSSRPVTVSRWSAYQDGRKAGGSVDLSSQKRSLNPGQKRLNGETGQAPD